MATVIHHFDSFDEALQASLGLSYSLADALGGASDFASAVAIAAANIFYTPEGQTRPTMEVGSGLFVYQTTGNVRLTVRQVAAEPGEPEWYAKIEAPSQRRPSSLATAAKAAGWAVFDDPGPEPDPAPEPTPDEEQGPGAVINFDPSRFRFGEPLDDERWWL